MTESEPLQSRRILVTDDDPDIRKLICTYLELEGFEVQEAVDGNDSVAKTIEWRPDLVLMDIMMPNKSGTDALIEIRADFRTAFIPVVFLTAKSLVTDKVGHLLAGADDYIVKPFDPAELVARVEVTLRRSKALRGLNPLTGLPGNTVIAEEIERRLVGNEDFAVLYIDLDNFKAFNDHYGFARGDELIKRLTTAILDSLLEFHRPNQFGGHVGGDDFVSITDTLVAEDVAAAICRRFDAAAVELFDEQDVAAGFIQVEDRRGEMSTFPLASVSVGVIMAKPGKFTSGAEVATVAAEVKNVAKKTEGSSWTVDRRKS